MKCKNRSKLLCAALLLALPVMCEALPKSTVQRVHRQAPKVSRASAAMPYGASLNEEQSLRALESEISRKLGSKIQESDYPKEARLQGWSGTTLVGVVVGADGKIKRGTVTKTSGFPLLDQQALRMLDGVTIWWIPQRLRKRKVIVTVPVGFYVRNN
jgi:TonB family protein